MTDQERPSRWAVEQFGADAAEVLRHVVVGLQQGQRTARTVHAAALAAGARDNHAYGAMWTARYHRFAEQFERAGLPGSQVLKPKGAPYSLAVVHDRVLIPFRHATTLSVPITQAKLRTMIPRRVSREHGVEPAPTLFDVPPAPDPELAEEEAMAAAIAAAQAERLTVVYVAYVANADSDDILAAWWGIPASLDDDGTLVWSPEQLDLSIAAPAGGAGPALPGTATVPGFAQGAEPPLRFGSRPAPVQHPASEPEPPASETVNGDD
ncbi:hypothetical protein [Amycolatopsis sp. 195334CR]|uniref:hypothetical protein n=1 Tax=Amycolatopsis sp. 195334CR TaxID=2814588 RepID=UPI001A8C8138|nr:hypothetical protein [Amycolatopsis sp. 195334CR]MBN6040050.1 hypothetical protein [Amycolatopsis sp. 195334CR]